MKINYYPWKAYLLQSWLKSELADGKSLDDLLQALDMPYHLVLSWLRTPPLAITLPQLQAISRYRGQAFETTVEWLGICPAHLNELIQVSSPPHLPPLSSTTPMGRPASAHPQELAAVLEKTCDRAFLSELTATLNQRLAVTD